MTATEFWRAILAALLVFITFQTLTPQVDTNDSGFMIARIISEWVFGSEMMSDKVLHFGAYGILGAVAAWAKISRYGAAWTAPIGLSAYGGVLEVMQALGGVRTGDWIDASANMAGAFAGFAVGVFILSAARARA
ncbi:MAG: VanZ family protein [Pseudomonadota bacterium]